MWVGYSLPPRPPHTADGYWREPIKCTTPSNRTLLLFIYYPCAVPARPPPATLFSLSSLCQGLLVTQSRFHSCPLFILQFFLSIWQSYSMRQMKKKLPFIGHISSGCSICLLSSVWLSLSCSQGSPQVYSPYYRMNALMEFRRCSEHGQIDQFEWEAGPRTTPKFAFPAFNRKLLT